MNERERMDTIAELARAVACLAGGDDDGARAIVTSLARSYDGAQQVLPGMPKPQPSAPAQSRKEAALRVFAYWRERCPGRVAAKPTPQRIVKLMQRLGEGYTEAELRKACDGAAHGANVNKETGERYDDLTLVCRDGAHLESFIARGVAATGDVDVQLAASSPVEDKIAEKRRQMAKLRRDGRVHEYNVAVQELETIMRDRKAS